MNTKAPAEKGLNQTSAKHTLLNPSTVNKPCRVSRHRAPSLPFSLFFLLWLLLLQILRLVFVVFHFLFLFFCTFFLCVSFFFFVSFSFLFDRFSCLSDARSTLLSSVLSLIFLNSFYLSSFTSISFACFLLPLPFPSFILPLSLSSSYLPPIYRLLNLLLSLILLLFLLQHPPCLVSSLFLPPSFAPPSKPRENPLQ